MHTPVVLNINNFRHELISFLEGSASASQKMAKAGLTDFSTGIENFYRELAELIFGEPFSKAVSVNQEFFDIQSNSHYIQVTCRRDATKIKETLDKFYADPTANTKKIHFMLAADRADHKDSTFKNYSLFKWKEQVLGVSEIANKCCTSLKKARDACVIARSHLVPDNSKINQAANKNAIMKMHSIAAQIPISKKLLIDMLETARRNFLLTYPSASGKRLEPSSEGPKTALRILDAWSETIKIDLARVQGNPIEGDFTEMIKHMPHSQSSVEDDPLVTVNAHIVTIFKNTQEWVDSFVSTYAELDKQANYQDVIELAQKLYSEKLFHPTSFAQKAFKEGLGR